MDIRNILHQKKENKKKKTLIFTIWFIVIILITLLVLNIVKDNNKLKHNIGDIIQISWTIINDNNYPINTHKIFNQIDSFGIKSSSVNLNNLINKPVIINWIIESIYTKNPILKITNIKDPDNKIIINDNRYFFTRELISLDFSQDTDIRAEKENGQIQIYYQDEPVISIETFICNKITPSQDCENMISNYKKNLNEMFTTYLWYTFYKIDENSRITFNNKTLWYIVKTKNNDFLLNISHLLNIIDSSFIAKQKQDLIKNNCVLSSWIYINTIDSINTQIIDEDLIKFEITWLSKNYNRLGCKLIINVRDNWDIKNSVTNEIK